MQAFLFIDNNTIFLNFQIRIIDCFLIEGEKVLFRVCLALVRLFAKKSRQDPRSVDVRRKGAAEAFLDFCRDVDVSPDELLKRAFSYRGLSRSAIAAIALSAEAEVKAGGFASNCRSRSNDNLPDAGAVDNIRAVSDNLTYKQVGTVTSKRMLDSHFCLVLTLLTAVYIKFSNLSLRLSLCSFSLPPLHSRFFSPCVKLVSPPQGMSTPQPRRRNPATYPVKQLNSTILAEKDVKEDRCIFSLSLRCRDCSDFLFQRNL